MRLFVALDIDEAVRSRIATFITGMQALAPDVRFVAPESLHVTLKFIGEFEAARLAHLKAALHQIKHPSFDVSFRGTGFFPTPRSARVFWVGIAAPPALPELAAKVDDATAPFGIEREMRAFTPHLTLARSGSGRPGRGREDSRNERFQRVQERLAKAPPHDFGTMTAREFFLYESKLSPKGAKYNKLERFRLA
jgi:RNA 2',3'-cyclic 3'-phosphodiesterase